MIYTIKVTDQAAHDIRSIYEYIAYELQSPFIFSSKESGKGDFIIMEVEENEK